MTKKYEFHIGDYVETNDSRIGYIDSICDCELCQERGFYEPRVVFSNGDIDYITCFEYNRNFDCYKRIGKYQFNQNKKTKLEEKYKEELKKRRIVSNAEQKFLVMDSIKLDIIWDILKDMEVNN